MFSKIVRSKSFALAIIAFILTFASVIMISWVAYYLKAHYKMPTDPNSATLLAAITGFWGSIVGGIIGGAITFWGVKMTIDKNDRDARKKDLQEQLASIIFLAKEIKKVKDRFERLPIDIQGINSALSAEPNPPKNIDEIKRGFQVDLKTSGWNKYILQIKSPSVLEKVWRIYDDIEEINDSLKTDITELQDRFEVISDKDQKRKMEKLRLFMRIQIDQDKKLHAWNKLIAFDTRKLEEVLDAIDLQKKEMEKTLTKYAYKAERKGEL